MVRRFYRAAELRRLAESYGLESLDMAGCEGFSTVLPEAMNRLAQDAPSWQRWVDLVLETSGDPAVVGMAKHILYAGRKPG